MNSFSPLIRSIIIAVVSILSILVLFAIPFPPLLRFSLLTILIAGIFWAVMVFVLPREIRTIFKREFKGYFNSPIAYVLFVVFLGLSNGLSFFFFGVLESQEASLTYTYFQYMPLYLALIVPAVGMRIWSEEQRQGTIGIDAHHAACSLACDCW